MRMECTEAGQAALEDGVRTLTPLERKIMLLVCGSAASHRMLEDMGPQARLVVRSLEVKGLVRPHSGSADTRFPASRFPDSRFQDSGFLDSGFLDSGFLGSSRLEERSIESSLMDSRFLDSGFLDSRLLESHFADSEGADADEVDSLFPPDVSPDAAMPAIGGAGVQEAARAWAVAGGPAGDTGFLNSGKLYMLAVMRQLRDVEASRLSVSLSQSADPDRIVFFMNQALAEVGRCVGPHYAGMVFSKMKLLLPAEWHERFSGPQ